MVYLVQYSDYLEQRILGAFALLAEAEAFVSTQIRDGYGWFEVFEVEIGKPFALRSLSKRFISGGKEIDPDDLQDLFEGDIYLDEEEEEEN